MSTRASTTSVEPHTESAPRRRSRVSTREELQLAMLRIKNKGLRLSISAVATEAGVSAGLIHNTYPDIAEEIRAQVGRGTRQQRDAKAAEVKVAREQLKTLRAERDAALADVARLASINETLRQEVATLQAAASGKIVVLPPRRGV
ncbi:TetR family transcriptional regulator [Burkholderia seminalis]|uniref:TetR family transcriptional regulator n=1 Tax=Burkholderia seminalis TaxID=488731 RepID=UPI0005D78381|nr:TetR family transcriptional regulator [Burkholderia seminalis]AJY07651.1 tetR family transcriptional regulator-like protein [Burkholderia vietnamiensis LMG 10929]AVR17541.1 TetR family transcriptional regulator [Burkholderia vietnamiensis]KVM48294.1 TetR family transcriptional regulator [Burkholderia vietnamiensis]KVS00780.1 TetR family transcriptional regulator [Burkholderia vietnamiensis]MCA7955542.1 TetR family transcriptional regulator [Burkholderia seminalis]